MIGNTSSSKDPAKICDIVIGIGPKLSLRHGEPLRFPRLKFEF